MLCVCGCICARNLIFTVNAAADDWLLIQLLPVVYNILSNEETRGAHGTWASKHRTKCIRVVGANTNKHTHTPMTLARAA